MSEIDKLRLMQQSQYGGTSTGEAIRQLIAAVLELAERVEKLEKQNDKDEPS
jgi:hypothetical protein